MCRGQAGLAAGWIGSKGLHQQDETGALIIEKFGGVIWGHFWKLS
jgi:hypothetical protein